MAKKFCYNLFQVKPYFAWTTRSGSYDDPSKHFFDDGKKTEIRERRFLSDEKDGDSVQKTESWQVCKSQAQSKNCSTKEADNINISGNGSEMEQVEKLIWPI